jgi:Tfp pilus assembly protein PilN
MSQVNLLPPEIRQKAKVRAQAILVGTAGAALIGLLIMLSLLQGVALRSANSDLSAQVAVNSGLEHQVADLQPYEEIALQLESQQAMVASAMQYEVSWPSALRDLQLVLPDEMALDSFNGTVTASAAPPPTTPAEGPAIIGSISVSGTSQGSMNLARWLTRLEGVEGWGNPWMSTLTDAGDGRWTFPTTIDIFDTAVTTRGQGSAV